MNSLGLSQATPEPNHARQPTVEDPSLIAQRTLDIPLKPSGREWVRQFPTSRSIGDLNEPFETNCRNFVNSLKASGASVDIAATLRPPERAYLMHYSYRIAKEGLDPAKVPAMAGVDIDWTHGGDKRAAVQAAKEMVAGYGIVYKPALNSRHSQGLAIDMDISNYRGRPFVDGDGNTVKVRNHDDLVKLGASFGVKKLASDPPHWSSDGR
jgi:D-alanyl-D-alanine dipeptidase